MVRDGEEVAHLHAGAFAGERSLLYGEPRAADVVVYTKSVHAAFLDAAGFEKCLGPIADVLKRANVMLRRENLELYALLGVGTFGKVKLVRDTAGGKIYAMKIISKAKVVQYNQQEHIINEKKILAEIDHPFIVGLVASFKDAEFLYMVLEYCPGGELFSLLSRERRLCEEHGLFYSGSVMLAFEYLHDHNIIYRDLKPENILLDSRGYCKICDFGFAKYIKDRTWTLCGTPEYLAPETIRNKGHGKGVDWWALGILTYEMLVGFPPYSGETAMATYKSILEGDLEFPNIVSSNAKDLIRRLLHPMAARRLGCLRNGPLDVRIHRFYEPLHTVTYRYIPLHTITYFCRCASTASTSRYIPLHTVTYRYILLQVRIHRFYEPLDTHALLRARVAAPFPPEVKDDFDTSNFGAFEDEPDEPYVDDGSGWDESF